jgi:hypothetical protein
LSKSVASRAKQRSPSKQVARLLRLLELGLYQTPLWGVRHTKRQSSIAAPDWVRPRDRSHHEPDRDALAAGAKQPRRQRGCCRRGAVVPSPGHSFGRDLRLGFAPASSPQAGQSRNARDARPVLTDCIRQREAVGAGFCVGDQALVSHLPRASAIRATRSSAPPTLCGGAGCSYICVGRRPSADRLPASWREGSAASRAPSPAFAAGQRFLALACSWSTSSESVFGSSDLLGGLGQKAVAGGG